MKVSAYTTYYGILSTNNMHTKRPIECIVSEFSTFKESNIHNFSKSVSKHNLCSEWRQKQMWFIHIKMTNA